MALPATDTLALLALHTPPPTVLAKPIVAPAHTDDGPVTVPASGVELMVNDLVAIAVPQLLLTA
jgi:hypothetical protein